MAKPLAFGPLANGNTSPQRRKRMAKTHEKAYSASGDRIFAADEFAAAKAKLLMFRILSIDVDVRPDVPASRPAMDPIVS
jgi:hypothetical protein